MLKSAFLLINVIGFILFPFLYMETVNVDHKVPVEIQAGQEIIVEVVISKANLTGPARLKLDFTNAENLTASEMESAGASFTFKDNAALFIWYSIPGDDLITLKYKLSASADFVGAQTISGTFSFVDGEERRKIEIPAAVIEIKSSDVADTSESNDVVVVDSANPPPEEKPLEVSTLRTIEKEDDYFIVQVTINKEDGEGFARLKESLPIGFVAESIDAAGAVFSFKNEIAKFLWSSVSGDSPIVVSYKLLPNEQTERGTYAISGTFSAEFMVIDDVPTSKDVALTSFIYETGDLANMDKVDTTSQDVAAVDNTTVDNTTVDNNTVDNSSAITTSISFKVQIVASHKNVTESYINKRYGINENIALESHEGWVKYTVGGFDKYKSARDKRQKLSPYDLPGPFVTAYNAGERISIQEALMVANQDWIK
ncbi:MAG: hypothetical protein HON99_11015 [Crocinitomicaceae bacterium]|nr:hypothetical protein [Crocinitomicaceae bacterium]